MKVEIDKNGIITIEAETPIEAFALDQITKNWNEPERIEHSIMVKTGLEKSAKSDE